MKPSLITRLAKRIGYEPIRTRNGGFHGALQSRLTSDWIINPTGPNSELRASIRTLRDRARDLEKNNPLVRRYLHLVGENVIGHKGIKLQCRTGTKSVNARIEAAYAAWGQPTTYSVDGRQSCAAFQRDVIRTVARDGEAFVRLIRGGPHGLMLQNIDAALIDETYNSAAGDGVNAVKLGVEVDQWNRPVAYHVFQHPVYDTLGTAATPRTRIPASELLHLFLPRQAGAVRGETWLAPVMMALRMLDGYAEAELVAARTAAAKMGFIVQGPDAETDPDAPQRTEMEAAAGTIDVLGKDQTFQSWDPTHPSQNFALFVKQVEKFIASGLNVSYAALTSDLVEVNFSSSRVGLLQERDGYRVLQSWFAEHFCEPVLQAWKVAAWSTGKLPLRMTPDQYAHQWQPRGWAYANPQQEQAADMMAMAAGLTSPQRVVADNGEDLEEIYAEIAEATALAEQYGVETYLPNTVIAPYGETDNGTADTHTDSGSSGTGDASSGGRAHPRVALIRRAS
jgi:lambda family phage portal protein